MSISGRHRNIKKPHKNTLKGVQFTSSIWRTSRKCSRDHQSSKSEQKRKERSHFTTHCMGFRPLYRKSRRCPWTVRVLAQRQNVTSRQFSSSPRTGDSRPSLEPAREILRMYLRWSLCTLHLHACQVRVGGCTSGGVYVPCIYTHAR